MISYAAVAFGMPIIGFAAMAAIAWATARAYRVVPRGRSEQVAAQPDEWATQKFKTSGRVTARFLGPFDKPR
jgi:hypothetical protein